jgi:tRNA A37 threonylcarbamoyladenosine modification protein TsaB
VLFVGDGALRYASAIQSAGGRLAPAHFAVPRAAALLWLADIAPALGRIEDIAEWEPLYLRESGAERTLKS